MSTACPLRVGHAQAYNASVYMFMAWYVDRLEPIHNSPLGWFVYLSLNGFWCAASAAACRLSYCLLHPADTKPLLSSDVLLQ